MKRGVKFSKKKKKKKSQEMMMKEEKIPKHLRRSSVGDDGFKELDKLDPVQIL